MTTPTEDDPNNLGIADDLQTPGVKDNIQAEGSTEATDEPQDGPPSP